MTDRGACFTCEASERLRAKDAGREPFPLPPATHRTTKAGDPSLLLCDGHATLALIAGWGPEKIPSPDGELTAETK